MRLVALDANTGAGLNGATVENLPQPGKPIPSGATGWPSVRFTVA